MESHSNTVFYWFTPNNKLEKEDQQKLVDFLYEELGRFGDTKEQIQKAIDYAMKEVPSFGGIIGLCKDNNQIIGATVINATGMDGYIPPYILVYIAISKNKRGQGLGKLLIKEVFKRIKGSIALHVEPDNPAIRLYERIGFTNKYLEMRYQPSTD